MTLRASRAEPPAPGPKSATSIRAARGPIWADEFSNRCNQYCCPIRTDRPLVLHGRESSDGRREFPEGTDHPVRSEVGDRQFRIAEIDRHHRHAGRPRGADVGDRVPDDEGPAGLAAGLANRRRGKPRGRAWQSRDWTADGGEAPAQVRSVQKAPREPFEPVGADGKPVPGVRQAVQHRLEPWKRRASDWRCARRNRRLKTREAIDVGFCRRRAFQDQGLLDSPCAAPDQGPGLLIGHNRQAVAASVTLSASIRSGAGSITCRRGENNREHGCLLAAGCGWRKPCVCCLGGAGGPAGAFHRRCFARHPRHGRRSPQARRLRPRPRICAAGDAPWARHRLDGPPFVDLLESA